MGEGPILVGDALVGRIDVDALEEQIEAAWEQLAEACDADAGIDTDAKVATVMRSELTFGRSPGARSVFLKYLRRCATAPRNIGVGELATQVCLCVGDAGLVYCNAEGEFIPADEAEALPPGERRMRPCERCNPAYKLWVGGHFAPDHKPCPECAPALRRASRRGAGDREGQGPVDVGPIDDEERAAAEREWRQGDLL